MVEVFLNDQATGNHLLLYPFTHTGLTVHSLPLLNERLFWSGSTPPSELNESFDSLQKKKTTHGNRIFGKNSWKLIIPRSHLLTLLLPAILCTWVMLSSRWFRGLLGIYLPWWGCIVDPIGEEYSLFCLVFGTSVGRECYRCFHYLHVPTFPTRPY